MNVEGRYDLIGTSSFEIPCATFDIQVPLHLFEPLRESGVKWCDALEYFILGFLGMSPMTSLRSYFLIFIPERHITERPPHKHLDRYIRNPFRSPAP